MILSAQLIGLRVGIGMYWLSSWPVCRVSTWVDLLTRKSVIYTSFAFPLSWWHDGACNFLFFRFSASKTGVLAPLVTLRSMWQSTRIHTQTRRANLGRLPGITLVSECVPWVVRVVRSAWDVSIKHTQWRLNASEHIHQVKSFHWFLTPPYAMLFLT